MERSVCGIGGFDNILSLLLHFYATCGSVATRKSAKRRMTGVRVEVFCPLCAAAGIRRKLMEVDSEAKGVIWPWCKGCKKNVRVELPLKK